MMANIDVYIFKQVKQYRQTMIAFKHPGSVLHVVLTAYIQSIIGY